MTKAGVPRPQGNRFGSWFEVVEHLTTTSLEGETVKMIIEAVLDA